ncbi:metal-sensitive transcriptional regulator [Microlunatus aurantiacus]|uniref:Metal-sensitive transcriptional regulator n=1 Tax=Microlunatus aurantiacus TaxID=446786 RepID=A0ABP7E9B7_9ACTN
MSAESAESAESAVTRVHADWLTDKAGHRRRLRRIEQLRGLQRLVQDDRSCVEVLIQVSAVDHALRALSIQLPDDHLRHRVQPATQAGDPPQPYLDEMSVALARLIRS